MIDKAGVVQEEKNLRLKENVEECLSELFFFMKLWRLKDKQC